jgi:NTP pyrophosphatase (non-canonical NTP hydrolase)
MAAGRGFGHPGSMMESTASDVAEEVMRARAKFPSNEHLLAALMEEVGELAKALLEGESVERIRAEAAQVACVAVRIIEEGDSDFYR